MTQILEKHLLNPLVLETDIEYWLKLKREKINRYIRSKPKIKSENNKTDNEKKKNFRFQAMLKTVKVYDRVYQFLN